LTTTQRRVRLSAGAVLFAAAFFVILFDHRNGTFRIVGLVSFGVLCLASVYRLIEGLLSGERPTVHMKAYAVVATDEASTTPYPYVYVESDGTVRELHAGERKLLEIAYSPMDGARPYIKAGFDARDGWKDLAGFCPRSKLPPDTVVLGPPVDNPHKPMSRDEILTHLRAKGLRVEPLRNGVYRATRSDRDGPTS
jgi:hypothetical protein